jgi:hypothetical protein
MAARERGRCRSFRHRDGIKHRCHRDEGHRGGHHADSGLIWSRSPHARRPRMSDGPCPDCEPVTGGAAPGRAESR